MIAKSPIAPTLLLAALLSACAGQPAPDTAKDPDNVPIVEPAPTEELPEGEYAAELAEARALLEQRELLPAASILRQLPGGKLSAAEQQQQLLLETELFYLQGETQAALELLEASYPDFPAPGLDVPLQDWRLRLLHDVRGPLPAARYGAGLLRPDIAPERQEQLEELTWKNLNRCSPAELERESKRGDNATWQGWLELALAAAQVSDSPDVQVAELDFWRQRHPGHVLAQALPGGLAELEEAQANAGQRVALVLPLSEGPSEAGRAVLDGFMAARFQAEQMGWPPQQLEIMDSGDYADINAAYEEAVLRGARLVIGSLTPESLQQWRTPVDQTIPMLALARSPTAGGAWQFSLAAEDEARQAAELAFAGGARRALLIRPEGDWGDRTSTALLDRWRQLEGEVASVARYSGQADYSSSLKAALNLAASEQRATRIRQLMGEQVEFAPRRRQDLDVVFLLASDPQDARSIKPLIAFHYAGDLPVYATSQIFSGQIDPQRDRDLNGIRLVETPWILERESPLPALVSKYSDDLNLSRLYALGADVFLLNWRVAQLANHPSARLRGYTGLLSMDENGRVQRELVPSIIKSGVPAEL